MAWLETPLAASGHPVRYTPWCRDCFSSPRRSLMAQWIALIAEIYGSGFTPALSKRHSRIVMRPCVSSRRQVDCGCRSTIRRSGLQWISSGVFTVVRRVAVAPRSQRGHGVVEERRLC